mmetsp:Transcript_21131/g.48509  ORF Transcript_21131/g.48509 Transcript_21131/m.48509 type:complete len:391 (+) Transcript_21131:67-1239(+)
MSDDVAGADDPGYQLFSRLYTYEECVAAHRGADKSGADLQELPDHWKHLDATVVDPGKWVFWLPEGWGQGIRTTSGGKSLKCFISPEGKRYFHKKDIEKHLGYALATKEPLKMDDEPHLRDINKAVPVWPKDFDLPQDWRLAYRRLPSTLHKIYVPPGQDEGFLYQGYQAKAWVEGNTSQKLSKFNTSNNPEAAQRKNELRNLKKRQREENDESAGEHFHLQKRGLDWEGPSSRRDDKWARPATQAEAATAFVKYRDLLKWRGFKKGGIEFAFVYGAPEKSDFAGQLNGIYYKIPYMKDETSAYQKIHCCGDALTCDRVYMYRSEEQEQWQICSMPKAAAPKYAYCKAAKTSAVGQLDGPWMVCSGIDANAKYQEVTTLKVFTKIVPVSS